MGNTILLEVQEELKAHICLLHAHLQRKSDLFHQNGKMCMRRNYYRSNLIIKDSKELSRLSKLIKTRLQAAIARRPEYRKLNQKEFNKIIPEESVPTTSMVILTEKEIIISDTKETEEKNQALNKRFDCLLRTLREKKDIFQNNQIRINENSRTLTSPGKRLEVSLRTTENSGKSTKRRQKNQSMACTDSTQDSFARSLSHHKSLSSFSQNKFGLDILSHSFRLSRHKSMKNLKAYLDLSENAALLLSKQSLRSEMKQFIHIAEKELSRKLEISSKKIKKIKALGLDRDMSFVFNENKAVEMEYKIKVLEKEIEDSRQEREFMNYISNVGQKFQEFESKQGGLNKKILSIESLHNIDISEEDSESLVEDIEILDEEFSIC